jgi:hypothetical protein
MNNRAALCALRRAVVLCWQGPLGNSGGEQQLVMWISWVQGRDDLLPQGRAQRGQEVGQGSAV